MAQDVTIFYFAALREQMGRESETVSMPAPSVTVETLVGELRRKDGVMDEVFAASPRLRVAINQTLATFQDTVRPGDELAFFPPMTGG
ncbi:molybdopterin converting factor small subunit MoeD [Acetobacter orleanensis NRIC 0473]|uniref:Molybdopterin synthase sulfur carrier subunit n=2 Tax=Acetobacter orleanensis TaxID=104099 RepID=A0A4Y3TIE1_9PROT|nr:molybdopterin converting factor [Acetobacter orleanensis]PCD80381.1 molybdopterin converting factor subunit 1 [Acetobacter orleanensis]GAN68509.1 molybdopterin converting factor small subunit MoeD [Acetobacter orleanensis JCM 7639]GBR26201.1 molybdopterin converting factor small subunit MoeD [Acetobacter orleanensis NRIC 0473]GEB81732.1 molybdopterin synthase sulfur carrier subunit [Acetobacter orleanensis]